MFEKKYDIKLDQDSYYIGEKVTGRVDLLTDKGIKAQNVIFYVYGQEKTKFVRTYGEHSVEYSYDDIFFNKDFTFFFESKGLLKSGKLEIPNDVREIPFEFIIPTNALESYQGKHVKITYRIHLYANKKWGAPIEKEKYFIVMGPLRTVSTGALKTVSASSNIIKEMYLDGIGLKLELEKNAISPGQTLHDK